MGASFRYSWGWICAAQICLLGNKSPEGIFLIVCGSWRKWEAWLHFRLPSVISLDWFALLSCWHIFNTVFGMVHLSTFLAVLHLFCLLFMNILYSSIYQCFWRSTATPSVELLSLHISSSSSTELSGPSQGHVSSTQTLPGHLFSLSRNPVTWPRHRRPCIFWPLFLSQISCSQQSPLLIPLLTYWPPCYFH